MLVFEPKKRHLRKFCFISSVKKSAIQSHRLLVETYGEAALNKTTCRDCRGFNTSKVVILIWKTKNVLKNVLTLVEDAELEVLLDEDPCQTQGELAES